MHIYPAIDVHSVDTHAVAEEREQVRHTYYWHTIQTAQYKQSQIDYEWDLKLDYMQSACCCWRRLQCSSGQCIVAVLGSKVTGSLRAGLSLI